ncbi:MAG: Holliday junction branch migration protein RuvA, partial [Proteobacteria bacterium]|nr:Holliday junction branch migration protein RuvA [Pseudomonadota bacterium]
MIAELTGAVAEVGADTAVIDVGGVGYLVFCSAATLRALPARGERASLKIETHVREDRIQLFGFATAAERDWFRALQSVQGVGARVALAILSVISPRALAEAIAAQDPVPLTRANGVGPKLAKRIAGELKDAVSALALDAPGAAVGAGGGGIEDGDDARDAVSALVNLGYGRTEAHAAVA